MDKKEIDSLIKNAIDFHRNIIIEKRSEKTYGVVIKGINELSLETIENKGLNVLKYYPIEGDK